MSAEEFKGKIGGVIANGFAAVGLSMGTRLGLFEGLAKLSQSKETAVTTQQLADSLKYKERYVREWINGVALAGILSHEEIEGVDRYWIEPHCLPALLGDGMSWTAQIAESLTGVASAQEIVEKCFPEDGPRGTDVDQYPILHEFLSKWKVMWSSPDIINKIFGDDELLAKFAWPIKMSAEEFKAKIGGVIANGFAAVGISMGTRLGLFEGLAKLSQSKETSVTTQQLADSLKYKERYVREWINGVALAGILSHEEIEGVDRYWIEPHCLPALLGDSMTWEAVLAECVTAVAVAQEMVEHCFPEDGPRGTDVDQYPILHYFLSRWKVMWNAPDIVKKIFDDDTLLAKFEEGINVVEIGCGVAAPTKALATRYPKSKFVASDISEETLESAKDKCLGLDNVDYAVIDACNVSEDLIEKFDFVMLFDVYHDVPYPDQLLAGIKQILKPGGMFMMNDVDWHESVTANKERNRVAAAMSYTTSSIYCMPTSYKHPGGAALGSCAGKELYERKLKAEFSEVKKVAEDVGLFFLCTK